MISRSGWCSLQLVSACISKDSDKLARLSGAIATEFDTKDIREIWHKAKITLLLPEIRWLKEQLLALANSSIAA